MLEPSTTYYCRVRTDLSQAWGRVSTFTTGDDLSLAFITNPISGAQEVDVEPTVTAQNISSATLFTIELNTDPTFAGTSITKSSKYRSIKFQLAGNQTYYARVQTDRVPNQWGPVRHFTTRDVSKSQPTSRRLPAGLEEPSEISTDPQSTGVLIYPNPFQSTFTVRMSPQENEHTHLRVIDSFGRLVFFGEVDASEMVCLGEEWPVGVYVVDVLRSNSRMRVRVVKR
jgi:hypothetical protein